jgi:DNA-binding protein HU-beta
MMNRTELIDIIASDVAGMTKADAGRALESIERAITNELAIGGEVRLVGFGTFAVTTRPAREGRNPATGEKIKIAEQRRARFKMGTWLKDALNPVRLTGARRRA